MFVSSEVPTAGERVFITSISAISLEITQQLMRNALSALALEFVTGALL
jgi:hypothetical protein